MRALGGAEGIRTLDPYVANVMLYQLSYCPEWRISLAIVERATYQPTASGARVFSSGGAGAGAVRAGGCRGHRQGGSAVFFR